MSKTGAIRSVTYGRVGDNEVFEPDDQPEGETRRYVRTNEPGNALRVKKVSGQWQPVDNRPLHAEISFFGQEEPGKIVGNYAAKRLAKGV